MDKRDIICIMAAALANGGRYPLSDRIKVAIDEAEQIWNEVTRRQI